VRADVVLQICPAKRARFNRRRRRPRYGRRRNDVDTTVRTTAVGPERRATVAAGRNGNRNVLPLEHDTKRQRNDEENKNSADNEKSDPV